MERVTVTKLHKIITANYSSTREQTEAESRLFCSYSTVLIRVFVCVLNTEVKSVSGHLLCSLN